MEPSDDAKSDNAVFPSVEPTSDKLYRIGSAVASLAPGGQSLLQSLITPPLQKRMASWIESIDQKLDALERENRLSLENLMESDKFSAFVYRSAQLAAGSGSQEKLNYLRDFVVNVAARIDVDEDELSMMLDAIGRLTPSAIRALMFYAEPMPYMPQIRSHLERTTGGLRAPRMLNERQGEELQNILGNGDPEFWQRVFLQLSASHLVKSENTLVDKNKPDVVISATPTAFGYRLLEFIRS